jgi:acetyltransferase-like isoleucine patch superfamily enzyme
MTSIVTTVLNLRRALQRRRDPIAYARRIGVNVGEDCRLIDVSFSTEPYLITLGNHVSATKVRFETHDGGVWVLRRSDPTIDLVAPITVGDNVFIGFGAVVLPGVTVGDNVVIGAGAVVTRDIPSDSIAVGVPARVVKSVDEYTESALQKGEGTKHLAPSKKRKFYERKYMA